MGSIIESDMIGGGTLVFDHGKMFGMLSWQVTKFKREHPETKPRWIMVSTDIQRALIAQAETDLVEFVNNIHVQGLPVYVNEDFSGGKIYVMATPPPDYG